jgi:hypothetical protein
VFEALVRMLAVRRWGGAVTGDDELPLPRPGSRYVRQTTTSLRKGRVLEVIRPVSVTLYETLEDPPCRVRLQLRWRIHTVDDGTLLRLDLGFRVNHAAALRLWHWHRQLERHCEKMLALVHQNLERSDCRAAGPKSRSGA